MGFLISFLFRSRDGNMIFVTTKSYVLARKPLSSGSKTSTPPSRVEQPPFHLELNKITYYYSLTISVMLIELPKLSQAFSCVVPHHEMSS